MVLGESDYDRFMERLDACKPGGWAELWLAGAGAGVALAAAALVGALMLSGSLSGAAHVLWSVTGAGITVLVLCLAGYLTQRGDRGKMIDELRKDFDRHRPAV